MCSNIREREQPPLTCLSVETSFVALEREESLALPPPPTTTPTHPHHHPHHPPLWSGPGSGGYLQLVTTGYKYPCKLLSRSVLRGAAVATDGARHHHRLDRTGPGLVAVWLCSDPPADWVVQS